ncbi:MAG: S9 family peptidase [Blastocatellia bacterium]|nr:S9 family peptidase [Blastocatellia bacterium]
MIRRLTTLACCLLFCAVSVFAQEKKNLTIDDLFDPQKRVNFSGSVPFVQWLPDGKHYLLTNFNPQNGPVGLSKVEAVSGTTIPFHTAAKMEDALANVGIKAEVAKQYALLLGASFNGNYTAVVLEHENDLYCYDMESGRAVRLTNTPKLSEREPSFSPDGKWIGFVAENNLYVVDVQGKKVSQLTTDGSKTILNGVLDWVYEEEVYGRGTKRSYWWSPDSQNIAYLQIDEAGVPEFTVSDDIPQNQNLEITNYPKSGDVNPRARLGVVATGTAHNRWVDLTKYKDSEFLITRVGWNPDSKHICFQVQNREQNWLDLNLAELQSGKSQNLLREESQGKAWVDVVDLPTWLPDGSFLWQSDRTGWRHIYKCSADGKAVRPVTKGNWDVRDIAGVATDGWVYFTATERSYIGQDVYRIKLDGSEMTRLSKREGTHQPSFNASLTHYIDNWSNIMTPPKVGLHQSDGPLVRVIEENKVAALDEFKLSAPEFLQVKTRDGFQMEAMMIKPPDFDPNKKYPVMSHTYSGPGTPMVRNAWSSRNFLWHQMLAQKGYLIWICDNRSASNKGPQSAYPVYRNLGELELRDLEDGVAYLKQQPFVDSTRIGIWGWSYGGYMTAYTLTHSTSFKIGISGAPVTDWHNYDSIYTERYMGLPQNNPEGYKKSSVTLAAGNLNGKLLLIHGLMDDNVHIQNSVQFIDALQKAGKQFDVMFYPQSRHGVAQPQRVKHMYKMMTKFITDNL